jgi:hypothetical protein
MAFGEFWDTCDYTDCVLNYNQDRHRQQTVDWIDSTGGTCAAFDFTTKGILQVCFHLTRILQVLLHPPPLLPHLLAAPLLSSPLASVSSCQL